jgi:hypothetical protein
MTGSEDSMMAEPDPVDAVGDGGCGRYTDSDSFE